jgi:HPt (histidine-containing phosphotransfer) domain-containing protein
MKFKCEVLDQAIIDDLLEIEKLGAKGFIKKQYNLYLDSSKSVFDELNSLKVPEGRELLIDKIHRLGGFSGTLGIREVQLECQGLEIRLSACPDLEMQNIDFLPLKVLIDKAVIEIKKLLEYNESIG